MKSFIAILLMTFACAVMPAIAQDEHNCSTDAIVERVDSIHVEYQATRSDGDSLAAFNEVENLYNSLGDILDECRNIVELEASGVVEVGSGTFDDPYAYDYFGDTGQGYLLKVSRIIRPADQYRHRWEDPAPIGFHYVAIVVEVQCIAPEENFCEVDDSDFEMTGDSGVVYDNRGYSSSLEEKLRPGGEGSGSVFFLVEADDSGLLAMFKEGYYGDVVIYRGEPAPGQVVEEPVNDTVIVVGTKRINVRGGPGTSFAIVGTFQTGEQAYAVGRNSAGSWLQLEKGWVFAQLVRAQGNVESLPISSP